MATKNISAQEHIQKNIEFINGERYVSEKTALEAVMMERTAAQFAWLPNKSTFYPGNNVNVLLNIGPHIIIGKAENLKDKSMNVEFFALIPPPPIVNSNQNEQE